MFSLRKYKIRTKNRKRFKSIISNSNLKSIFSSFEKGNELTDEEVKNAYKKFSSKLQTNTISAAELEFVTLAVIATKNKNLINELLTYPLLMLVWSYGNDINSEFIIKFIDQNILSENAEPYGGIPDENSVYWLNNFFKNNKKLVNKILEEVIKKNNKELENL